MGYAPGFELKGLYGRLPDHLQRKLAVLGSLSRYSDGQHIQSRGDRTRGFSIIKTGAICFGKTDMDGKFMASAVFEPNQCYGELTLFADLPRTHDAVAVGETSVLHISKPEFDRLLDAEPELAKILLQSMSRQMHITLEWFDDVRRYPLKFRLGKSLLQLSAQRASVELKVTQSELADAMGVSRVAIGKELKDYKARGFIALKYGEIHILEGAGFKKWLAGFEQLEPIELGSF